MTKRQLLRVWCYLFHWRYQHMDNGLGWHGWRCGRCGNLWIIWDESAKDARRKFPNGEQEQKR